ncbi:hypothetical protein DICPUDRAFT_54791 [Dictyostelium purpureum]|uniref:Hemolysin III n=1 Tax=Dictyostelium purpureum TaxID=5786 RepID=F0ZIW3_DICPU|nr:uncharacterized protein DICPUDRAFT_54791 [Dictyostelium purpureum]EGC36096.1 hypothetical protein DICPUDRAFT_54791 [Dictyostelium purpureum]|eukprot:XP_003287353.1 hypothetical protein DICPUDRAFT_54791 [Dictyostelium purpureum]
MHNFTVGEIEETNVPGPEVQTYNEEVLNSLSHGLGLVLCIPAVFFLISLARMKGSKWHVLSCSIYGITLMTMYFCSTLYHSVDILNLQRYRSFFKDLDHCAIYFLIAGTYTPLTLINLVYNNLSSIGSSIQTKVLDGAGDSIRTATTTVSAVVKRKTPKVVKVGWLMFILIWTMCFFGVGSKLILGANGVPDIISNSFYLLMGWTSIIGLKDLITHLPKKGLKLLVSGGVTYTSGVAFLIWETAPFNHAVWHLFVSAGTLFHYFCILECLLPSKFLKKDSECIQQTNTTTNLSTGTSNTVINKATINTHTHSVILEHFEYAEEQIRIKFFGSGKRKIFIIKYMNVLYSIFLGWWDKMPTIKKNIKKNN